MRGFYAEGFSMAVVAVLAGGRSPEHDVSLQSASQVLQNMGPSWSPWPVFLDRDGQWWPARTAAPGRVVPDDFRWPSMTPMRPGAALEFLLEEAGADVVFPVLHGPFGEDGSVQGMLELHGVPFVGSGCAASAVAMDKIRTRECLAYHGIPMPRVELPREPLSQVNGDAIAARIGDEIGFPCFLKVDVSGSTLGVQYAAGPADVVEFVREHRHAGRRFLAEALVTGEEITVPVLGNSGEQLIALPPVGIYPREDKYFTYAAKYTASLCEEVVPPRGLDEDAIAEVQVLAERCHRALQCDGMSRTDIIMGPEGPMVLEVNTIPGLTEVSLLPRSAAAAGLDFPALIDRLLELSMQRAGLAEAPR